MAMVKSVIAVNHQGLRDWMIQRVTAVILTLGVFGFVAFFITHPHLSYVEWRMLFSSFWMRVAFLMLVLSFAFHAWIGMWTVMTDYIKSSSLRFVFHVLVFLTLLANFLSALLMMWSF